MLMNGAISKKIQRLLEKGVNIPCPASVEIGETVSIDRISGENVTIHAGSKIQGEKTWIGPGVRLGEEAPVTIENCWVAEKVSLKGGYFSGAVFLPGASAGSGSHVRAGTILEEQASIAHSVGLKQTILFPFVTLGSLINFCDIFMAGGTGRQNHSEVGSAYIHFNYTPNQDKATPSLLGDVPGGVMLDREPIFLGGQGGLVGPCRLAYGTVIAAGSIYRKDMVQPHRLLYEAAGRSFNIPHWPGIYRGIKRVVANNIQYIAQMIALRQWYRFIRFLFVSDRFPTPLHQGLLETIEAVIDERVYRLKSLSEKMSESIERYRHISDGKGSATVVKQQQELMDKWPDLEEGFTEGRGVEGTLEELAVLIKAVETAGSQKGSTYIDAINKLDTTGKKAGTRWLQGIVDEVASRATGCLPSIFPPAIGT